MESFATKPREFADLVVASGIHTAGHEEVGVGIANAHKLLALLIRAPKAVNPETPDSASAEDMVDMALEAGFSRDRAQFFDTITQPDVGPRTESLSVVFTR